MNMSADETTTEEFYLLVIQLIHRYGHDPQAFIVSCLRAGWRRAEMTENDAIHLHADPAAYNEGYFSGTVALIEALIKSLRSQPRLLSHRQLAAQVKTSCESFPIEIRGNKPVQDLDDTSAEMLATLMHVWPPLFIAATMEAAQRVADSVGRTDWYQAQIKESARYAGFCAGIRHFEQTVIEALDFKEGYQTGTYFAERLERLRRAAQTLLTAGDNDHESS
jgi:hypothetical protein